MSYNQAQLIVQACAPKLSSFLSILGSSAILSELRLTRSRQGPSGRGNRAIHRLLTGMSISDLSFSCGWLLTTWPSPAETTDYVWGAVGNTQTCSAQAFFISLGFWGTPVYNTVLSLYYLLMIVYGWTDERLLTLDPFVHGAIWTTVFLNGFILLGMKLFNNYGTICYIHSLPMGCTGDACIRGNENAWKWALFNNIFPIWPCIILNITFMTMLYFYVRKTERKAARYTNREKTKHSGRVRRQAMCYVLAMLLTFIPDAVYVVLYYTSEGRSWFNFPFETFAYLCLPLQGFLNFLVFMRQRKAAKSYLGRLIMFVFCCNGRGPCCSKMREADSQSPSDTAESSNFAFGSYRPHGKTSISLAGSKNSKCPRSTHDSATEVADSKSTTALAVALAKANEKNSDREQADDFMEEG